MASSRIIHDTTALCPSCNRSCPASVVERDRDAWLQIQCAEHGTATNLYFRDARFYEQLHAVKNPVECCDTYDCAQGMQCSRRATRTMIFMVNVTNNCNMTCDACLSGSEIGLTEPYEPAERIMAALPDARGLDFAPHAVFFGGEPTMHPDLPRMVELAVERGYVPRLATNGLKLRDRRYCQRLVDSGLTWVFLHFDSLDDDRNKQLRGMAMTEATREAISTAVAAGMRVQLGVTVSSMNIDELGAILRYAREQGVFWVSLYPVAEVERYGSQGTTFLTDVVDALGQQTNGAITQGDFLAAAKLWSRLFKLTGRFNYRQKPTMVSLPVVTHGDQLVPLTRLMNPVQAAQHPLALARLARSLPNLLDYEHKPPSNDMLVINIQQFQGRNAFDLSEAVHTLMSFAHRGSYYPFDIFNHVHRWPGDNVVGTDSLLRRRSAS